MRRLTEIHSELFADAHMLNQSQKNPRSHIPLKEQGYNVIPYSESPLPPLLAVYSSGSPVMKNLRSMGLSVASEDQISVFEHFTKFSFMRSHLSRIVQRI